MVRIPHMLLLRRFGALTLLFCYLLQSPLPVWLTDSPVAADLCCSACSADGACCCLAATEGATACDMATITGALLQPAPCGVESMVLPVISSGPAYLPSGTPFRVWA